MDNIDTIRKNFQSLSYDERERYLLQLNTQQKEFFYQNPEFFLFDKQIITGEQGITVLICGRGWGKTFCGSGWIARKVINGSESLAIIGATYKKDMEQVMVKAILEWFPKGEANYVDGMITFKKYPGTVYCYSAGTEIRGPNMEYCWCDEVVKWCDSIPEKVEESFKVATTACRLGNNPQILVTSTPKPFPLILKWKKRFDDKDDTIKLITGTMYENPFLSDSYKKRIEKEYQGDPRGYKQEILGEILDDVVGAAWNQKMINDYRVTQQYLEDKIKQDRKYITRIIVGVDPTVSDKPTDECGIITGALAKDGHVYIIKDDSGKYTTDQWAHQVIKSYYNNLASLVVVEKDGACDLITKNIHAVNNNIVIKGVKAASIGSKMDRALPISALYERGLVHHVGYFPELEYQMTSYSTNSKKSPDRMDALVWTCFELKLSDLRNPPARGMLSIGDW